MKSVRQIAHGDSVLLSLLLMISLMVFPLASSADGTQSASLIGVERLVAGEYSSRVSIQIGNRVEHLLMSPNTQLNDLSVIANDGTPVERTGTAYVGVVESLPSSWARIMIDGKYVSGTIDSGAFTVHFSSEAANTNRQRFTGHLPSHGNHMLSPLIPPDVKEELRLPGRTAFSASDPGFQPDEVAQEIVIGENLEIDGAIDGVTRVARIGVVVDSLYQEAIGGRGISQAISVINSVDGIYREKFGLALKVDVVLLITDEATLDLSLSNLERNLNRFRDYRISSELLPDDLSLVHLFTGIGSQDDAVGLAFKGAACRIDGYDVSMSRPFQFPVVLTAHEIGHNLNAAHDDETVDCATINDHVMFSAINPTTMQEFSSCSTDAINTWLEQGTCYTAAIDIDLDLDRVESNQILATVTNLDAIRAIPSATLFMNLESATVAEAPSLCELEDPSTLTCAIPATFAGDHHELAIKLSFTPDEERTVNLRLEPNGYFDLNQQNNSVQLVIPGDSVPLSVTGNGVTTEGAAQDADESTVSTEGNSALTPVIAAIEGEAATTGGGGGSIGSSFYSLLLLAAFGVNRRRFLTACRCLEKP